FESVLLSFASGASETASAFASPSVFASTLESTPKSETELSASPAASSPLSISLSPPQPPRASATPRKAAVNHADVERERLSITPSLLPNPVRCPTNDGTCRARPYGSELWAASKASTDLRILAARSAATDAHGLDGFAHEGRCLAD